MPLCLMLRSIKFTKTPGQKRVEMGNISPRQLNDGSKIGTVWLCTLIAKTRLSDSINCLIASGIQFDLSESYYTVWSSFLGIYNKGSWRKLCLLRSERSRLYKRCIDVLWNFQNVINIYLSLKQMFRGFSNPMKN